MDMKKPASGCTPYLVVLAIALAAVAAVNGSFLAVLGGGRADLIDEWLFSAAVQLGLVSVPFLLLAFLHVASRTPWLVGMALTFGLWGYFAYDVLAHRHEGRGVNIGLSLIMLASPLLISAICMIAARRELQR